jgi:hypothetical protein
MIDDRCYCDDTQHVKRPLNQSLNCMSINMGMALLPAFLYWVKGPNHDENSGNWRRHEFD